MLLFWLLCRSISASSSRIYNDSAVGSKRQPLEDAYKMGAVPESTRRTSSASKPSSVLRDIGPPSSHWSCLPLLCLPRSEALFPPPKVVLMPEHYSVFMPQQPKWRLKTFTAYLRFPTLSSATTDSPKFMRIVRHLQDSCTLQERNLGIIVSCSLAVQMSARTAEEGQDF